MTLRIDQISLASTASLRKALRELPARVRGVRRVQSTESLATLVRLARLPNVWLIVIEENGRPKAAVSPKYLRRRLPERARRAILPPGAEMTRVVFEDAVARVARTQFVCCDGCIFSGPVWCDAHQCWAKPDLM